MLKFLIASALIMTPFFAAQAKVKAEIKTDKNTTNLIIAERKSVLCSVVNIRRGQLALRFSPNGKSRAGLDNGDFVRALRVARYPWVYVVVQDSKNPKVIGLEGWVNSEYLFCGE